MTSSGTAVLTLPSDTQILITREFAAPKDLVWRAWTEPQLIKRWWAGQRGSVTSAEVDLRVGGTWRYVMVAHGDFEVAFHGEYSEVVPNERLVGTEIYEGAPEGSTFVTVVFTEDAGRTTLTQLIDCDSPETRTAIIASGMEAGMQEAMDALEQVAVLLA